MSDLSLANGLSFEDLYSVDGLARIDQQFLDFVSAANSDLAARLFATRENPSDVSRLAESELMLALAPLLEQFVGTMFGVEAQLAGIAGRTAELDPVWECKRVFVQRKAAKSITPQDADALDGATLATALAELMGAEPDQETFAQVVMEWLEDKDANADALAVAQQYAGWAVHSAAGREKHADDALFQLVGKTDYFDLVATAETTVAGVNALEGATDERCHRDGFDLTDPGTDLVGGLDEANYCVICHERGRDFCSTGMREKQSPEFKQNPLGIDLCGCPLEERISEMHACFKEGNALGGLAIATVDNPMIAATGHRICNDCMKSCIFQKQDPVDIPQAETRILKEILGLPWGFEIYGLLTRWNPLNFARPTVKAASGYNVLVVGLGPAGFTLAHHLLNEGHTVVAVDGLKIEPLDPAVSGVAESGARVPFKPVRDVEDLYESLDERAMAGFGGVAEYGITVRWNKNYLKVIRLLLERRATFAMYGGVRFGGSITEEVAYDLGFHHIALCAGAGKPTYLSIPNGLARGVRQASDFLMGLQLTGAAKMDSITNLQLRLPAVVIGGGLTAIDTATEALAYYARQVTKFVDRYEALVADKGEAATRAAWSPEEGQIAQEFIDHGLALRDERATAKTEGREPDFIPLLQSWGGATIAYRRRMIDAPSYTLNHEEITKAFEQGIWFAELLAPSEVVIDEFGHAQSLKLIKQEIVDGRPKPTGQETSLPARAILIAAGTQPNTTLSREFDGFAEMNGKYYQGYDEDGNAVEPEWVSKPNAVNVIISKRDDGRSKSYFGDLHPAFAGNVVSAMASAKQGYPVINRQLAKLTPSEQTATALFDTLNAGLRATVHEVIRLTSNIIEVVMHAPFAANAFKPGQFFRLMNYETHAVKSNGTTLGMEGLALTGAWVDRDKGLVSVIVLEMGGSSNLCDHLKPGEPVVLMGPTGTPTETPPGETVMLVGGGLGNAVLFSIGQAFRAAGSKVLYFGGYKQVADRYHVADIHKAGDVIVWCCDEDPGFAPERSQDKTIVANIVQAMVAYADGSLGPVDIPMNEVDRVIAIGSHRMMEAVGKSRHGVLKEHLKSDHFAIGSINSPMQCMMKEICAQCLQRHVDPKTGEEKVVFSCFNQDQPLDWVDFNNLDARLAQNGVQEKLTRQWIFKCLDEA